MEMKHRCFEPYEALTVGEAMFVKEDILPRFIGKDGYFLRFLHLNHVMPIEKAKII